MEKTGKKIKAEREVVLEVQKSLISNPQKGIAYMYSGGLLVVNNGYNAVKVRSTEKSDEDTELLLMHIFIQDAIVFYVKNLKIPEKKDE